MNDKEYSRPATIEKIDRDGVPVKTLDIYGLVKTKNSIREKDILDRKILEKVIASMEG